MAVGDNNPGRPTARRRSGGANLIVGLLLALVATACGTNVSPENLAALNGSVAAAQDSAALDPLATGSPSLDEPNSQGSAAPTATGAGLPHRATPHGPDDAGVMPTSGRPAGTEPGPAPGAAGGAEVLLGSFGTGSGIIGAQLRAVPVAVRAWAADVNARGGLGGRPVRVLYDDDQGNPGRALAIARRMVEQEGVVAFVGAYAATTIPAVAPYLEDRGVPMIGNVGSPTDDASPMIFNPQVSNLGTSRAYLASLVSQSDARDLALFSCRESETCAAGRERIRAYAPVVGVELVYEAQISLAQPDFTAEVIAARNAGAEAVAVIADVATMGRVIRSAERQGWRPVFVGSIGINEEAFAQNGEDAEGTLAPAAVAPYATSPAMADYRKAIADHVPGGLLGGTGAQAWVQGKLIERAFELIDPGHVTPEAIVDALRSLEGETLGGTVPPLSFADGPHAEVNLCIVPIRFVDGRFVPSAGERFMCSLDSGLQEAAAS